MGFQLSKIISELLLPPGILIILFALGLWAFRKQYYKTARWLLYSSFTLLLMLSIPVIATALVDIVERYPPLTEQQIKETNAQAIVVLAGGRYNQAPEYHDDTVNAYTLERLRYGVHLYRLNNLPMLVSGGSPLVERKAEGDLMALVLISEFDITPKWVENRSRNTQENAEFSREILNRDRITHIMLVTHAAHMARSVSTFEKAGFKVTPAPTRYYGFHEDGIILMDFVPNVKSLEKSYYALHEIIGQIWYWLIY